MLRDWDQLSEEWQDYPDSDHPVSFQLGGSSARLQESSAPSTMRVIESNSTGRESQRPQSRAPWDKVQMKDIFAPLTLEQLFAGQEPVLDKQHSVIDPKENPAYHGVDRSSLHAKMGGMAFTWSDGSATGQRGQEGGAQCVYNDSTQLSVHSDNPPLVKRPATFATHSPAFKTSDMSSSFIASSKSPTTAIQRENRRLNDDLKNHGGAIRCQAANENNGGIGPTSLRHLNPCDSTASASINIAEATESLSVSEISPPWISGPFLFKLDYDTTARDYLSSLVNELTSNQTVAHPGAQADLPASSLPTCNISVSESHEGPNGHSLDPHTPSIGAYHVSRITTRPVNTSSMGPTSHAGETASSNVPPHTGPRSNTESPPICAEKRCPSYPSDIDFLEDAFNNSLRRSPRTFERRSDKGSMRETSDHCSLSKSWDSSAIASKMTQPRMLTIRNLNNRNASVVLSRLGAHSKMTFNADKQCWEGSEDFPDDMLGQPETNAEAEGRRISQSSIAGSVIATCADDISLSTSNDIMVRESAADSVAPTDTPAVDARRVGQPSLETFLPKMSLSNDMRPSLYPLHVPQTTTLTYSPASAASRRLRVADLEPPSSNVGFLCRSDNRSSEGVQQLDEGKVHGLLDLSLSSYRRNDHTDSKSGVPMYSSVLHAQNRKLSQMTSFAHMRHLRFLDISGNHLEDLSGLGCLYNLRELHAANNRIQDCSHLESFRHLMKVNLRGNRISRININGVGVYRMEFLDLSCNHLHNLAGFESFNCLRELLVDQNCIDSFQLKNALPTLEVLTMDDNRLRSFEGSFFPRLRTLSVARNHISRFKDESTMISLLSLTLDQQSVESLQIAFAQLGNLMDLRVSDNPLKDLNQLSHNNQLRYLEAGSACITHIPKEFAKQMQGLLYLDLSNNSIANVKPLRYMTGLRSVDLSGNAIADFGMLPGAFKSSSPLEVLDLRYNPITIRFYPDATSQRGESIWLRSDESFLRGLSDIDYVRRICYRSSIMSVLKRSLRVLDGVPITDPDKDLAKIRLKNLNKSMRRSMNGCSS